MALDTITPVQQIAPPVDARYRLSIPTLISQLLPAVLRKPGQIAWLSALLSPVGSLYSGFLSYRATTLRLLSYNGQTILLEKALNDTFDPLLRRIVVRNTVGELTPVYLNFEYENQPAPFVFFEDEPDYQPLYLHEDVEFNSQVDFTVFAPDQAAKATALNTMIRRLKRAMTNYQILYTPAP